MLWKKVQHSWRGGRFDKALMGRTDLAKYAESADELTNFTVKRTGCIAKRRGTELVCDLKNLLGNEPDGTERKIGKMRVVPVERDDDGRYLVFTDNRCFVAKKSGVLLCDGTFARHISPYDAYNNDGTRRIYSGADNLANATTPIAIRRYDSTTKSYKYLWYAELKDAYAALQANDTIQLHCDYVVDNQNNVTNAKNVPYTLDLYGYTLTVNGKSLTAIRHQETTADFDIHITSSRTGGRVAITSWGNDYLLTVHTSQVEANKRSCNVTIDNIEVVNYVENTGGSAILYNSTIGTTTINSGIFRNVVSTNERAGRPMIVQATGYLVINGGTFIHNATDYNSGVMFAASRKLTINGGYFELNFTGDPKAMFNVGVIGGITYWEINGGYFNIPEGGLLGYEGGGYFKNARVINRIYTNQEILAYNSGGAVRSGCRLSDFVKDSTVRNDAWPDADGMFGLKQEGEDDYRSSRGELGDKRPYAYAIPYADDDLASLSITQVGDTLFIAHRNYPPAKITTDDTGYPTWSELRFDVPKWKRPVIDSASMSGNGDSTGASRTIKYCVTYVKDGIESPKSAAKSVTYKLPWAQGAVVLLNFSRGDNEDPPDYYNVYKDNGTGWGLIGRTSADGIIGGNDGVINTEQLWIPKHGVREFQIGTDYEMERGLGAGGLTGKVACANCQYWPSANDGDVCLMCSEAFKNIGIKYTFEKRTQCNFIRLWLDGRLYDKETGVSYLLPANPNVKVLITGLRMHPTVGPCECLDTVVYDYASPTAYSTTFIAEGIQRTEVDGFIGWRNGGAIFADWITLTGQQRTLPNGDKIYLLGVGEGQQTEWFNRHRRYIDIPLDLCTKTVNGVTMFDRYSSVALDSVRFVFSTSVYTDWYSNAQGTIRGIEFYQGVDNLGDASGTFQDDYITPDMSVTPPPEVKTPHFSGPGDYPACVGMYGEKGQRLVFASTESNPMGFWMSATGDLFNFTPHDMMVESDAISASLAITEKPRINHIVVDKYLLMLTDGSEWKVAPVSGNALSYKTVSANKESSVGCSRTNRPIPVGREVIFVDATGMTVRAIGYSFTAEGYDSQDLSVLSAELFKDSPVLEFAYRQHPDSHLECVLADGSLATLVYMKEHEMVAWSRQVFGGGFKAKTVACDQVVANGTSDCCLAVEKDGNWRLWRMRDLDPSPTARAQVSMDGIEFSKDPESFEEGMTVVDLGDGWYAGGFPFEARLVTVRPEADPKDTVQFEIQNATEVEIRVIEGSSFKVRAFGLDEAYDREAKLEPELEGGNVRLCESDVRLTLYGTNRRDGRMLLTTDGVWPLTILNFATTYQVEPANQTTGGKE